MPYVVEGEVRKEEDVAEASGELEDATKKIRIILQSGPTP